MKHPFSLLVGVFFLAIAVVGCTQPQIQTITVTREIPVTRIVVITAEAVQGEVCRLLGCDSQLTINLIGKVPDDFTIQATGTNSETQTVHCHNGKTIMPNGEARREYYDPACSLKSVTFFKFAPEETTISLRWGLDFVRTRTIRPQYDTFRPNGPKCEPECRIGNAEFVLADE